MKKAPNIGTYSRQEIKPCSKGKYPTLFQRYIYEAEDGKRLRQYCLHCDGCCKGCPWYDQKTTPMIVGTSIYKIEKVAIDLWNRDKIYCCFGSKNNEVDYEYLKKTIYIDEKGKMESWDVEIHYDNGETKYYSGKRTPSKELNSYGNCKK